MNSQERRTREGLPERSKHALQRRKGIARAGVDMGVSREGVGEEGTETCTLFGTTGYCAACNKMIPAFEMVMRAKGNVYHLECFACQQCNHRFCVGDRFYLATTKSCASLTTKSG
ncbi:hypothetical protein C0Q70_04584 [Pomacea canaliculata]|uniref:LIM zinc-binding domain-containing protein n=1 Tax=Pomacea canaliculata TaxID=400727 RepID=A0A2T7PIW7_POMCA|nr:hypothetical protein C0Q70_04584 [Pomacea canaliculata]